MSLDKGEGVFGIFTDSIPLLTSIRNRYRVAKKTLRQSTAFSKQSLEDKEVDDYSWIE